MPRQRIEKICIVCNNPFLSLVSEVRKGKGFICSKACTIEYLAKKNRKPGGWLKRRQLRRRDPTYRPKDIARQKVSRAVKAGLLIKPEKCCACGKVTKVEGHHDDYSKPLEVKWFCRKCHSEYHKKIKVSV